MASDELQALKTERDLIVVQIKDCVQKLGELAALIKDKTEICQLISDQVTSHERKRDISELALDEVKEQFATEQGCLHCYQSEQTLRQKTLDKKLAEQTELDREIAALESK